MSEIQLQDKCDKCGSDLWGESGYANIAGLCRDCAERLRPSYPSAKTYKEKEFTLTAGQYNKLQLIYIIIDCERVMYDEIRQEVTEAGKYMAYVISEYGRNDKVDEIIADNGKYTIKMSYFFTNSPYDCILSYEDKDKDSTVIWNKNIK